MLMRPSWGISDVYAEVLTDKGDRERVMAEKKTRRRLGKIHFEEGRNQWYVRIKGTKKFLVTGRENEEEALELARKLQKGTPPAATPLTLGEAIKAWVIWKGAGQWERTMVQSLHEYAGGVPLASVGDTFLESYARWLARLKKPRMRRDRETGELFQYTETPWTQGKKTIRVKVGLARTVLLWCAHRSRRYLERVPDLPKLPKAPKGHRDAPRPVLRNAFGDLPERAGAILRFILETGVRPEEACLLRWDEVDLEASVCRKPDTEHKTGGATGEDRVIYLGPAAKLIIEQQPRGGVYVFTSRTGKPYKPSGLRSILRRRGIKGGYTLRHSFAQNALEQGTHLAVLSKWMAHKSIETTQIYAQVRDHQAVQAAQTLSSPLLPQPASAVAPQTGPSGASEK